MCANIICFEEEEFYPPANLGKDVLFIANTMLKSFPWAGLGIHSVKKV
jgi:hypothetical protein